jgi:hypothetical protein
MSQTYRTKGRSARTKPRPRDPDHECVTPVVDFARDPLFPLERESGETTLFVGLGIAETGEGIRVPVSRERAQTLRELLLASAAGVRHN